MFDLRQVFDLRQLFDLRRLLRSRLRLDRRSVFESLKPPRWRRVNWRGGAILTLLVCTLPLGGCVPSLGDNPPRDANKTLAGSYGEIDASASAIGNSARVNFREFFPDPHLQKLIQTALENNQELHLRLQEIIIAQAEIGASQGEYLPKVEAGVGAGIEKVGLHTSQGVADEANGVPENLPNYTFGVGASWEVDIWNKLRNAKKAAVHRYLATIEGKNFMVTQLVAEVASSYYELMALDSQLEVLKRNIELQQDALRAVRLQKQAARVTELAVQRLAAEVLKNRSRKYELEQERVEAENRLNFLVGRFPRPVARKAVDFTQLIPNVVQTGVPSQLLENRPDVRQAEHELEAAKLDVQVAKARFYPSLSIEAGVGYETFNLTHLVATPESLAYGIAGNLTAPLLNRSAIEAQYRSANARQLQAVFEFERTLLRAYTEVANQLSKVDNLDKSYELEAEQVELLKRSIEVSNVLFRSARADYLEVLLTRREALDAEMELIETRRRQLQASVDLYQALGGGWAFQSASQEQP